MIVFVLELPYSMSISAQDCYMYILCGILLYSEYNYVYNSCHCSSALTISRPGHDKEDSHVYQDSPSFLCLSNTVYIASLK